MPHGTISKWIILRKTRHRRVYRGTVGKYLHLGLFVAAAHFLLNASVHVCPEPEAPRLNRLQYRSNGPLIRNLSNSDGLPERGPRNLQFCSLLNGLHLQSCSPRHGLTDAEQRSQQEHPRAACGAPSAAAELRKRHGRCRHGGSACARRPREKFLRRTAQQRKTAVTFGGHALGRQAVTE